MGLLGHCCGLDTILFCLCSDIIAKGSCFVLIHHRHSDLVRCCDIGTCFYSIGEHQGQAVSTRPAPRCQGWLFSFSERPKAKKRVRKSWRRRQEPAAEGLYIMICPPGAVKQTRTSCLEDSRPHLVGWEDLSFLLSPHCWRLASLGLNWKNYNHVVALSQWEPTVGI